ncbi:MAG: hypothetical protein K9M49_08815 [Candidatus Marinimicrobia bacterium]|nr:hypothetical protein [Candidatus Neomarinimicrobiota bacterium]MCF7851089.1 hypothetical protein [Candidatus Neomarinimicrobiota bacterium]MCF7905237.1 hypothetical protein [Candidatus Neomarinimicrobiota bacterium]
MSLTIPALSREYPGNDSFRLTTSEIQLDPTGFTCIIGKNGSGKSSFAETLAQVDQEPPWFYLPQFMDRFLFAENLLEQLETFFSESIERERLQELLIELGFTDPDHMLSFPFILMSGGERRRIALVSMFYLKHHKIILDEPEIGITPKEKVVLLTKIRNLKAIDTRVILISHNEAFVKESTSLICMKDGTLDRVGKTEALLNEPDFDLSVYGVRSQTEE